MTDTPSETKRKTKPKTKRKTKPKKSYWKPVFWFIVVGAYALLLYSIWALSLYEIEIEVFGEKSNIGEIARYALVFYTIASFRTVGVTELGGKLFFGKPLYEVSSGLVFIPLGVFQLAKETRLVIQDELPADPEHIFRGEATKEVPENMVPPIRIPFAYPEKESSDPLDRRITAEVVIIIRWRIENYLQFLKVIGSKKEARRQLNDTAIAMIFRELTKVTPAVALEGIAKINEELEKAVKDRVAGDSETEDWGAHIESAQIKLIGFGHGLNETIQKIPEAVAKKQSTILEAEADKTELQLVGEGKGHAERVVLEGRTAGLRRMASELELDPAAILGAETSRAITNNPGLKTIIPGSGGFVDLVGTAAAVSEVFRSDKDKPVKEKDKPVKENGKEEDRS